MTNNIDRSKINCKEPSRIKKMIESGSDRYVFLDVREVQEREISNIDGSEHIPMNTIPQNLDKLKSLDDKEIVVYCQHGVRSLMVIDFLQSAGFENLINLDGGICQWAEQVDPSVQLCRL